MISMSELKLFHVSEVPNIQIFEPRPVPSSDSGIQGNAVWAIDEVHLPNYLLPRDCPRVSFASTKNTTQDDKNKFLEGVSALRVIALESNWLSKIVTCQLFLYEFPTDQFEMVDAGAGYYISRTNVIPKSITKLEDLISILLKKDIEVRFLDSLWNLRDEVIASSLEFSIIRFRNAAPRSQ